VKFLKELDRTIFGYGSPTTLGVFRAIFATLILINLLMLAPQIPDWFAPDGYVPLAAASTNEQGVFRIALFNELSYPFGFSIAYGVLVAAAAMAALGLFTRFSTIVLAIGLVSLHHRNPLILHSGDTLMRVAAIYLAAAPCGLAFSLDRLRTVRRNGPVPIPEVSLWPQRLLQFQWALMYFMTAWAKSFGSDWRDGTAAWYPVHLAEFRRFPVPAFLDHQPFLAAATYGTLVVEVALATLVFAKPYRKWVLLGGLMLHASIEYRMNIPLFAMLSVSGYVLFYDGNEIEQWWARLRSRLRPQLNEPTQESA
jgi:hypothetical protein